MKTIITQKNSDGMSKSQYPEVHKKYNFVSIFLLGPMMHLFRVICSSSVNYLI